MTPTRFAPARRQLEAYEESWKQDHDAAMLCRDTEDFLAAGVAILQLLEWTEESWRDRVFREVDEYRAEEEEVLLRCYRDWLAVTEAILQSLSAVEQHLPTVEHADEALQGVTRVRQRLATWRAPTLSKAVGLRESQLSPEADRELQDMLAHPRPTPAHTPWKRLPAADASLLKKRSP
jgi:hypothetical protein